jgi:hypothetical protein
LSCISSNSEGSKTLPDDVGANTKNKSGTNQCILFFFNGLMTLYRIRQFQERM